MAGEDYWRPIRDQWALLSQIVIGPGGRPRDSEFVIKRWLNPFAGPDLGIALTGMRGTGKTTLHKALRRRLPVVGEYVPREESQDREVDRFVAITGNGKKRVQLVVVPGQKDSTNGRHAIRHYFLVKPGPTGVVHCLSWGFSTIWDFGSERAALEEMDAIRTGGANAVIEQLRAYNLAGELDDFRQTRDLLQETWRNTTKPIWLVLAISKVDLYRDRDALAEVGRYYIPAENPADDSEFAREVRGLVHHVGQGKLRDRIAVLPVCSYLEPYRAEGGSAVATAGDLDLTSVLVDKFANQIGVFCGVDPV